MRDGTVRFEYLEREQSFGTCGNRTATGSLQIDGNEPNEGSRSGRGSSWRPFAEVIVPITIVGASPVPKEAPSSRAKFPEFPKPSRFAPSLDVALRDISLSTIDGAGELPNFKASPLPSGTTTTEWGPNRISNCPSRVWPDRLKVAPPMSIVAALMKMLPSATSMVPSTMIEEPSVPPAFRTTSPPSLLRRARPRCLKFLISPPSDTRKIRPSRVSAPVARMVPVLLIASP